MSTHNILTHNIFNPYVAAETRVDDFDIESLKSRLVPVAGETPSAEKVLAMKLLRGDFTVENISFLWYKIQKRLAFWYLVMLILCIQCFMCGSITDACTVICYLHNFVFVNSMLVSDNMDQAFISNFAATLLSSVNIYSLLKVKTQIKQSLAMYATTLSAEDVGSLKNELRYNTFLVVIRVLGIVTLVLEAVLMIVIESSSANRRGFYVHLIFKQKVENKEHKADDVLLFHVDPCANSPDSVGEKEQVDFPPSYNDIQTNQINCYQMKEPKRTDGLDADSLA